MSVEELRGLGADVEADEHHQSPNMLLLGSVAWRVLTRLDLAVYVQSLHGHAHQPRVQDCKRLSTVLHQARSKESGV
eukprot:9912937-Karenia_brevis.AAC.1